MSIDSTYFKSKVSKQEFPWFRSSPKAVRPLPLRYLIPRLMTLGIHCAIVNGMKQIHWNAEKNQALIGERGISLEDILFSIQSGDLLDDVCHSGKYPNQRLFVVSVDDYVYLVPYIETVNEIFLKTIIPSRKATKRYLRGRYE